MALKKVLNEEKTMACQGFELKSSHSSGHHGDHYTAVLSPSLVSTGCIRLLDWTGLLDWTTELKLFFFVFLPFIARLYHRSILEITPFTTRHKLAHKTYKTYILFTNDTLKPQYACYQNIIAYRYKAMIQALCIVNTAKCICLSVFSSLLLYNSMH